MIANLLNNFDMLHVLFIFAHFQKDQHKEHLQTAISKQELEFRTWTLSNRSNPALTQHQVLPHDKRKQSFAHKMLTQGCGEVKPMGQHLQPRKGREISNQTLRSGATVCELPALFTIFILLKKEMYINSPPSQILFIIWVNNYCFRRVELLTPFFLKNVSENLLFIRKNEEKQNQ